VNPATIDLVKRSLDLAIKSGCRYADVRAENRIAEAIIVEDGSVEHISTTKDSGFGLRILMDDHWSFVSFSNPAKFDDIRHRILGADYNKGVCKIKLSECPTYCESIVLKPETIPSVEELKKIAIDCHNLVKEKQHIIKTRIHNQCNQVSRLFMNTEGSQISQEYFDTFSEINVTARDSGITQAVNTTEGGRGGMEKLLNNNKIFDSIQNISDKASRLVNASPIKEEKTVLIMNPDFVALLTHEILGHPSEGDRVMGKEMAWAGGSWWAGKIGEKIGSEKLNVFDDPTIEGTLGHYKFDDEGVRASRTQIIEEGVLKNHFQSRETAPSFNTMPTGNMRATSYKFMPLIRMACTCIGKGDWKQDEMIKETKKGYLICDMKIPSIDMKRYNWSISAQYAYKIEDGETTDMLRDVIVTGNSPDFFSSIDACGTDFEIRPILNCGKGDPMQIMMMGNGGPSVRAVATIRST